VTARRAVLPVLIATALALGCGDRPTEPVQPPPVPPVPPPPPSLGSPSIVVVSLTGSPHRDDGALVVTVRGPMDQANLNTFKPSADYFLFTRGPSMSEMRVSLVGNVSTGPLFRFYLAADAKLSDYVATVSSAATLTDSLRADVRGYEISLSAGPLPQP
jgi:hypothetical protein